ncbi:MAG: hypothetical protein VCD00_08280 [Candidatus Hydrogenedentota bacterium]
MNKRKPIRGTFEPGEYRYVYLMFLAGYKVKRAAWPSNYQTIYNVRKDSVLGSYDLLVARDWVVEGKAVS